jgi:hypothetical protein
LATDLAGVELQVDDWYVMFVNRGKTGPFRTEGEAYRGADGKVGARVSLIDHGNGGRVVSTCAATFHPAR